MTDGTRVTDPRPIPPGCNGKCRGQRTPYDSPAVYSKNPVPGRPNSACPCCGSWCNWAPDTEQVLIDQVTGATETQPGELRKWIADAPIGTEPKDEGHVRAVIRCPICQYNVRLFRKEDLVRKERAGLA